jgi:HK97 family phage prohead protease
MKDDGSSLPLLVGKFARYDKWNEIRSPSEAREMGLRGDRYMEKVLQGAFTKTLQERAGQIRVLFNHGTDPSIGKKPLGKIVEVSERAEGPEYQVKLFDAGYVRDLIPALEAGEFGSSYRSDLVKGKLRKRTTRAEHNPDGLPEATVSEIRLKEIGPVTFPAETLATAGVRSLTDWVTSEDLGLALRRMVHEEEIDLSPDHDEERPDAATLEVEDVERDDDLECACGEDCGGACRDDEDQQPVHAVRSTAVYLTSRRTRRQSSDYLSTEEVRPSWHL